MSADDRRRQPQGSRALHRRAVSRQGRRSLGLTALALIPGAGLTRTRYHRFGWVLLVLFVLGLVVLGLLVVGGGVMTTALSVAVQPDLLLTIAGVAVLAALVWIFSIILTHRGSEPPDADTGLRVGLRLFTVLMCLIVVAPTAQLVRYIVIQRDVVGTVFAGNSASKNTGGAKPNQTDKDAWKGVPRVNMLLIGSDAGNDRTGIRTDSMVVASLDTKTGNTVLISIPRNLQRAPFPSSSPLYSMFPNGYYCPQAKPGEECLINAVWNLAVENKALFRNDPDPGLTAIRGVIGEVTGLSIDYSTVIDLTGFESLVDAMGGVRINVMERLPINGYHLGNGAVAGVEGWIEPGYQLLDGHKALWFARSRLTTDDFSRMRRQRCLIGTILDQVNPTTMLNKYPQLAQVAKDNITTDVRLADLPAWVDLVQRVQKGSISSLTFTEDNINTTRPDFNKIRTLVAAAINPPAPETTPTPSTSSTSSTGPSSTSTKRSSTTTTPSGTTTRTPDGSIAVNVRAAC